MAVTAKMVKELRDMTSAGMMDCKKALVEADGDMDRALPRMTNSSDSLRNWPSWLLTQKAMMLKHSRLWLLMKARLSEKL